MFWQKFLNLKHRQQNVFLNAIGQNIKALKIEHWHSKSKSWTTYLSVLTSKKSRLQFNFQRLFGYVFNGKQIKAMECFSGIIQYFKCVVGFGGSTLGFKQTFKFLTTQFPIPWKALVNNLYTVYVELDAVMLLTDNAIAVYNVTNEIKICDKLCSANVVGQQLTRVAGATSDSTVKEIGKECYCIKNLTLYGCSAKDTPWKNCPCARKVFARISKVGIKNVPQGLFKWAIYRET